MREFLWINFMTSRKSSGFGTKKIQNITFSQLMLVSDKKWYLDSDLHRSAASRPVCQNLQPWTLRPLNLKWTYPWLEQRGLCPAIIKLIMIRALVRAMLPAYECLHAFYVWVLDVDCCCNYFIEFRNRLCESVK